MEQIKNDYSIKDLLSLFYSGSKICLSTHILQRINESCGFLSNYLREGDKAVYGINTGFGSLQNIRVPQSELQELQRNLLITHAAGTGKFLPDETVRLMMLLKIINISKGHSAVREVVVNRLIWMYNENLSPLVHEQGSLGASGDLAPLAEMCLPLIGMGKLSHPETGIREAAEVLKTHNLEPLLLEPKEALALINGTQFMLAHALLVAKSAMGVIEKLSVVAALSADAWLCRTDPFRPELHRIRPHRGQQQTAADMLEFMSNSELQKEMRPAVQDPYSFRCIPQVHGASMDALQHCFSVWETELNSVTDNPTVFPEEKSILSGGNFHGQPLALTLDYAGMALAELASISERRTYLLISGQRGLPPFLAPNAGTDSGYMIAQYTAASIVSRNKQLCTPASVDSIVSSNGQEDHVSMGANAGIKALQIAGHLQTVLSIEALCAAQAMNFRNSNTFAQGHAFLKTLKLQKEEHCSVPMNELISRAEVALNFN
jgi:histidine ammonia-lyase